MPELPEVEVTRLGLLMSLPGRCVTKISSSNKRLRLPVPRKLLGEYVLGSAIATIDRRAKYLLFRMQNGAIMVIHLGMTRKLGLIASTTPPAPHDHLRLLLDDTMELRFNDSRRFGCVLVWTPREAEAMEAEFDARLGVEPFSRKFNMQYLRQQGCSRKTAIKNFLMDGRVVAGIGNIYANEILFAASIHPLTPAGLLAPGQWQAVIASTRRILKQAIRSGGSTISDFLGSSGNPGYFQVQFKVYHRGDEKCHQCNNIISKIIVGGRATFFCPYCQPIKTE
ncbi:MAG: bifunctional DNA-formamidopyrimidine glycosylase/DNA-(apurinic or apyrimidinic site) lyase [Desulfobulbaceae bacterium]|nr:bifunctional DNA-formamidopyrimidine glycosylase/DNA-(apurinic or apyrimidinic site) lyase [Desulfobulbaceae bacterium]